MAGASLLALLDDIATLLDDVAVLTKVAAARTAGVLGDDLALNAEQVSGVRADRELPVVWAVAKGSLVNKAILVPCALGLSALLPWLVTPLLMVGGGYLCFEGFEKVAHAVALRLRSGAGEPGFAAPVSVAAPSASPLSLGRIGAFEREKIRGAIRTDFVLSSEIIVIALGTVQGAPLLKQALVVASVALLMTVGVYGIVAGIVKLDDFGVWLAKGANPGPRRAIGCFLVRSAPWLMRGLSLAGTGAMFLVGGGILLHGIPSLHHVVEELDHGVGVVLQGAGLLSGVVAGAGIWGVVMVTGRLRGK